MVKSVLVVHYHELEHQQGRWLFESHVAQGWRHSLICRVSKGGDSALESVSSVPCIFVDCWQC